MHEPRQAERGSSLTLGKEMMRRSTLISIAVAVVIIASLVRHAASNPLRGSPAQIRAFVQLQTPLGASLADVSERVKKEKWDSPRAQEMFSETKGSSIQGMIGEYQGFPFVTWVFVSWEFDSTSKLREIRVSKVSDAL